MKRSASAVTIPAALAQRVERMAAAERRPAGELVRDALESYLSAHDGKGARRRLAPQDAAARILALRKGNHLPEGTTVRDLQTFGRA